MNGLNIGDLDGWSVSHLLFFMMIGYLYPNQLYLAFVLGVCWELFESLYGEKRPRFLGGFGDCATTDPNVQYGPWWYGRMSDIVMNLMGLLIGASIKLSSNQFQQYSTYY